jgi:molybdate/tungstate transport system substrate-binding protein
MRNLKDAFILENPGVEVRMEAAGSIQCIRKITDLHQPCDVLAVADFSLIDDLMFPEYADWNIRFATNELCLAYTEKSRGSQEINASNWFTFLLKPDISFGRSDPDSDPCGYRTLMALQLSEKYYAGGIEWEEIATKDQQYIRSKETDLNALLESRAIDYIFTYRSVAVQHNFLHIRFPDSINLSDPGLDNWYSTVSVEIPGSEPGKRIVKNGASMYYGITIPKHSENPALAKRFIQFILDPAKGGKIIRAAGQNVIPPAFTEKSIGTDGLF